MIDQLLKKILILNPDYDPVVETALLKEAGYELVQAQCSTEEEVIAVGKDALGIINIYSKITERVAKNLKKCKIIVRAGVGYDMIDVAACRANGIEVSNVPDYCTEEVADHAVALLMAIQRRLLQYHRNVIAGQWVDTSAGAIKRSKLLTLGLVGFGLIGQRFAAKMREIIPHIIAYDPYQPDDKYKQFGVQKATLDDVLFESDVISLHNPLRPETYHLINKDVIARMTRAPILVNVSRGGLVDTNAVIEGLKSGKLKGAGLDVLETEPDVPENLKNLDNLILTPHAGWYSVEADLEDRTRSAEEIIRVLRGEKPRNPVP